MSTDLETLLHDVADRSQQVRLAEPAAVRRAGEARARRQRLQAAVGLALAVVVVGTVGRAVVERGSSPQPVEPLPSPAPTATATSGTDVADPGSPLVPPAGRRFSAHAIAVREGRFVVVGDGSTFDGAGAPVYWSDDAVHWQAPPPGAMPASSNVTDVIATDAGFLAVGVDGDGPGAWRSVDGTRWVASPLPAQPGGAVDALWGVTGTSRGYFAWGFDNGRAAMWRSDDGRSWAPAGPPGAFELPQRETICTVVDRAGGLVATGVVAPPSSRDGRQVAWSSANGVDWVLSQEPGAPELWCDPPEQLGHDEASTPAVGTVRVDLNGDGDHVTVTPPRS